MSIEPLRPRHRRRVHALGILLRTLTSMGSLAILACGAPTGDAGAKSSGHGESAGPQARGSWSVTAWGAHFEIFPEVGLLVAGETSTAHVHVTQLADFAPLGDGSVAIVLGSGADEQVFHSAKAKSPGLFEVELHPEGSGDFDLAFRIETPALAEQIRGGRVRVGSRERPGGVIVAPAPKGGSGGEPLAFLKEQQWRSDFATSWVRRGELLEALEGVARIRPPAGGEILVSSPVDGLVHVAGGWPFPGQSYRRGGALFRLAPRIAPSRSLAELEAAVTSLEIERATVLERLGRLEKLFELEATSRREVEEARARASIFETRHRSAERDLALARAARRGDENGESFAIEAPFDGQIAEVRITPGAAVAAGEALARFVRTDALWIELALSPEDAAQLTPGPAIAGLILSPPGRRQPIRLDREARLISLSPEASQSTGRVTAYFEVPAAPELHLGTLVDALVLLEEAETGIVIPASAVVDDGGVDVVYLQLGGESFLRQEIRILERQGERLLVDGLEAGQRLVHSGGDAIRRASLMSGGGAHGHVH